MENHLRFWKSKYEMTEEFLFFLLQSISFLVRTWSIFQRNISYSVYIPLQKKHHLQILQSYVEFHTDKYEATICSLVSNTKNKNKNKKTLKTFSRKILEKKQWNMKYRTRQFCTQKRQKKGSLGIIKIALRKKITLNLL